ncbi:MAG: GGDEF domain-containing protein [Acholeplasmatales bacterium]|nr:GGDEF domain-containing protein [Acholeplasmatales bacterium]
MTELYVSILSFELAVLLIVLIKAIQGNVKADVRKYLIPLIGTTALFVIMDVLCICINGINTPAAKIVNNIVNVLYFVGMIATTAIYFRYSERVQKTKVHANKKLFLLVTLPLFLIAIVVVLSVYTGWVFYIDENNVYQRGPLHLLEFIIVAVYPLFSVVKSILKTLNKKNYSRRRELVSIAKFFGFPIVGCVTQLFFVGIPLSSFGIVLGILWFYLDSSELLVYSDELTQLSNRNAFSKAIDQEVRVYDGSYNLYLMILDINKFKAFNDNFGHNEGDKALITLSRTLKQYVLENSGQLFRYAGDEFVILYKTINEEDVISYVNGLKDAVRSIIGLPYSLTISVGYEKYSRDFMYIPDFIEAADERLYVEKYTNQARKKRFYM